MEGRWAVVVTELYKQERVIEQFMARGFEYFFPQVRRVVRHRGRRVHRLDPLLFNYVPVLLSDGWEIIFDMRGVADVMGPARTSEIDRIKSMCDSSDILVEPKYKSHLKAGQKVKPVDGTFSGLVGTYVGLTNDGRESALFSLLGAKRSMKFAIGDLVAA